MILGQYVKILGEKMLRFNSVLLPFIKINSIGSMEINGKKKINPSVFIIFLKLNHSSEESMVSIWQFGAT